MGHPGAQAAYVGLSPEHMHMTHSIDGPLLDANMGFQYVSSLQRLLLAHFCYTAHILRWIKFVKSSFSTSMDVLKAF